MQAIFRLLPRKAKRRIQHFVGDLFAPMGRQAVHDDDTLRRMAK
jgi:hypothetical protein